MSILDLVDLAGSERQESAGTTGERLREGAHINKSLSTLALVVSKLAGQAAGVGAGGDQPPRTPARAPASVDRRRRGANTPRGGAFEAVGGGASGSAPTHIPFRNSKLTRLLRQSLGGNSFTTLLATITPSIVSHDESVSTLNFAAACKRVRSRATMHVVVDDATTLNLYRARIRELTAAVESAGAARAAAQAQAQAAVALLVRRETGDRVAAAAAQPAHAGGDGAAAVAQPPVGVAALPTESLDLAEFGLASPVSARRLAAQGGGGEVALVRELASARAAALASQMRANELEQSVSALQSALVAADSAALAAARGGGGGLHTAKRFSVRSLLGAEAALRRVSGGGGGGGGGGGIHGEEAAATWDAKNAAVAVGGGSPRSVRSSSHISPHSVITSPQRLTNGTDVKVDLTESRGAAVSSPASRSAGSPWIASPQGGGGRGSPWIASPPPLPRSITSSPLPPEVGDADESDFSAADAALLLPPQPPLPGRLLSPDARGEPVSFVSPDMDVDDGEEGGGGDSSGLGVFLRGVRERLEEGVLPLPRSSPRSRSDSLNSLENHVVERVATPSAAQAAAARWVDGGGVGGSPLRPLAVSDGGSGSGLRASHSPDALRARVEDLVNALNGERADRDAAVNAERERTALLVEAARAEWAVKFEQKSEELTSMRADRDRLSELASRQHEALDAARAATAAAESGRSSARALAHELGAELERARESISAAAAALDASRTREAAARARLAAVEETGRGLEVEVAALRAERDDAVARANVSSVNEKQTALVASRLAALADAADALDARARAVAAREEAVASARAEMSVREDALLRAATNAAASEVANAVGAVGGAMGTGADAAGSVSTREAAVVLRERALGEGAAAAAAAALQLIEKKERALVRRRRDVEAAAQVVARVDAAAAKATRDASVLALTVFALRTAGVVSETALVRAVADAETAFSERERRGAGGETRLNAPAAPEQNLAHAIFASPVRGEGAGLTRLVNRAEHSLRSPPPPLVFGSPVARALHAVPIANVELNADDDTPHASPE